MDSATGPRLVITIEEHSRIGGLGSAVAEVLAGLEYHPPLIRMGTDDRYPDTAADYEGYLVMNHLDVDSIIKVILDAL
jgi:transketolase